MKRFICVMSVVAVFCTFVVGVSSASANTWYVQATAPSGGDGSAAQPFNSLQQVEVYSSPGDEIRVIPSGSALDGGIQLKDGQSLLGTGPSVVANPTPSVSALITNSTNARLSGDAIRLADNNKVKNIHIASAYRAGILGINVLSPVIENNLITENMVQHSIQTLQEDFVLFEPQRNHYAGITLFVCGTATPNECQDEDASTSGIPSSEYPVQASIEGNVIRDSNVEGIVILNDAGVVAEYEVENNSVTRLSLAFDGFAAGDLQPPLVPEVVRSRGFTMITGNGSHATLNMDGFDGSYLAPEGDFASDGVVLVSFGDNAMVSADISNVVVTNPDWTGEIVNGDSLEFSHFGSNSIFDVRVSDAQLSDSVSTLIKLLEVGPVVGNSFSFDIRDSVLTNENPRARTEEARGAITYVKIPAPGADQVDTIKISVRDTVMSGHVRGLHLLNLNGVHVENMEVLVEDSTFSDMANEGFRIFNQEGTFGNLEVDLGGGTLGSGGVNSFRNNGPPADVAAVNLNFAGPPMHIFASDNYWGGGAPVVGPGGNLLGVGPVIFTADTFLTQDPNP